jgi:hypothetical protein
MATILRQISDEIDVGDNTVYYSRHKIDTITLSESIQRIVRLKRTILDTTSISETVSRLLSLRRLQTDITTTSESIRRAGTEQTYTRNISDVIALLERIFAVTTPLRVEIHPEQPFYPRRQRSRFQRRFSQIRL